jgi:protein-L-isoaspartate O-methyltransferase
MPPELEAALAEGATLVAPVGETEENQELYRFQRAGDEVRRTAHGAVRYVMERKCSSTP